MRRMDCVLLLLLSLVVFSGCVSASQRARVQARVVTADLFSPIPAGTGELTVTWEGNW